MMNSILNYEEYGRFLGSSGKENKNSSVTINQIDGMQRKIDVFYQHLENELDEKQKHKDKKSVKLDEPTKNYLDDLVANYELSKKKREYLTKKLKTTSTGPEGFTAQM